MCLHCVQLWRIFDFQFISVCLQIHCKILEKNSRGNNVNVKSFCQDVMQDTERLWTEWSDCSCKSSRSDEEGSVLTDVIYRSSTSSHMLPAVFSYLISICSFVLGCENMKKTRLVCIFVGRQWGLIRSLFYSSDFALGEDGVAEHVIRWPNWSAREQVFKMRFVNIIQLFQYNWNTVLWWVTVSSVVSAGTCFPLKEREKLLGKMKLQGRVGVLPRS